MDLLHDDMYRALISATTLDEFFAVLCARALLLGFEYCCYGVRLPLPVSNRPVHILDHYPPGWMAHYRDAGYLEADPTVKRGARTAVPLKWDENVFAEVPDLWHSARAFGLRHGVSQSSWSEQGTFALLSLSRSHEPISSAELAEKSQHIVWLSSIAHTLIGSFLFSSIEKDKEVYLTPREREVLCFTGDGKTSYEIASILGISIGTVNFHVNNILAKLDVNNKLQAAVKAVRLGLIN